jgi:hypothetical protein
LSTASDESAVLSSRDLDPQNHTISERRNGLFQFSLDFVDQLGFSAESNFVRGLSLTRAK